jgi:hypothetical protein
MLARGSRTPQGALNFGKVLSDAPVAAERVACFNSGKEK